MNMLFHENISSKEQMVEWLDKRRPTNGKIPKLDGHTDSDDVDENDCCDLNYNGDGNTAIVLKEQ